MPKGFMATHGKRNMDWRNDQAATLYYVEAIDAGNQKIKSILETKYGNGSAFRPPSLLLKPNNAFLGYLGNATTAIAFDEWYDTRNTNLSQSVRCRSKSKMISDRNSQDIYSDPGSFETIKIRMANKFLLLKTTPFFARRWVY
jgi:hypothetical protein